MMPVARLPSPRKPALVSCLRTWAAKRGDGNAVWKAFRTSPCGQEWFAALTRVYGNRCVYCDHSPAHTIDHIVARARRARAAFQWVNWLPACGDCNRHKNATTKLIQPIKVDPRDFIRFSTTTGEPEIATATPKNRKHGAAKETIRVLRLSHQVLNDARRTLCTRMTVLLVDVGSGDARAQAKVQALLKRSEPHRAILRDLLLEVDPALNPHRAIVVKALAAMPALTGWAKRPV